MSASSRVVAVDRILDAASRRRRRDMPGRYRYAGRIVTALVGIGQGLAAVAESVAEADEHARRRANLAAGANVDERELRALVDAAWRSGFSRGLWEGNGPDRRAGTMPPDREGYVAQVLGSRRGVSAPPPPREGWQG